MSNDRKKQSGKKRPQREQKPTQKSRGKNDVRHDAKGTHRNSGDMRQNVEGARRSRDGVRKDTGDTRPKTSSTRRSESARPCSGSESLCPVEELCGACQLLHISYAEQLAQKQAEVVDLFSRYAKQGCTTHSILGMENPFHYRNKVTSPYVPGKKLPSSAQGGKQSGRDAQGKKGKRADATKPRHEILCGMYAAHSHRVIPTDACLLENEIAKRIILTIKDLMPRFRIEPYREDSGTGFLRHAIVRVGHTSGEVLVTLVTNDKIFPGAKNFAKELTKHCPEITTIVQNINTRQTNVILGEHETTLYGPGFILDSLCGLSFRVSSSSFYQVNSVQTEVLYRRAIEMAQLSGTETVLDAYCGTGTIGLVAARGVSESAHAARVVGVDDVPAAIRDARNNARHNGIDNAEFTAADAGAFMRDLAASKDILGSGAPIDVVLMDPPRAGASEEFLEALVALGPARVVYISCNPKTQARDVAFLAKGGYQLQEIQAVDMFPHTDHVECIVSLTKAASS